MENPNFFHPPSGQGVLTGNRKKKKTLYDECIPPENLPGGSAELDSEVALQHHNTLKVHLQSDAKRQAVY